MLQHQWFTQSGLLQYVFFVPGNHDLWTRRAERGKHTSLGES